MPMLGLGLHVLVAICFAIHAIRTGREMYWLFILFMFPLLGSIVYAVAVFIPEMRNSRGLRRIARGVQQTLNPGAELRAAQAEHELSATVANRLRLADALVDAKRPMDAVAMYRDCLQGVYHNDAHIEVKLAGALLDSGAPADARSVLDALIAREPGFRSPQGHVIYARAVAECGDRSEAKSEFEALLAESAALDIRAYYADYLVAWGEVDAAKALARDALRHVDRIHSHAKQLNEPWIQRLRTVLAR